MLCMYCHAPNLFQQELSMTSSPTCSLRILNSNKMQTDTQTNHIKHKPKGTDHIRDPDSLDTSALKLQDKLIRHQSPDQCHQPTSRARMS